MSILAIKKAYIPVRIIVVFLCFFVIVLPLSYYIEKAAAFNCAEIVNLPLTNNLPLLNPLNKDNKVNLPLIKGFKFDSNTPLKLDFYFDISKDKCKLKTSDMNRLVKYFLGFLSVPQDKLWVNLSPYEADRITPDCLAQLDIGKDMLLEDYLLKELTASLTDPKTKEGKKFWQEVYAAAEQIAGTTNIPINTFYKVWIIPDTAEVYEYTPHGEIPNIQFPITNKLEKLPISNQNESKRNKTIAFVKEAKLKVLLETDYHNNVKQPGKGLISPVPDRHILRTQGTKSAKIHNPAPYNFEFSGVPLDNRNNKVRKINNAAKEIFKRKLLPIIENQVNNSTSFAPLRQLYYAFILATYFKSRFGNVGIYGRYVNKGMTAPILIKSNNVVKVIYDSYKNRLQKGFYNTVAMSYDKQLQKKIKHRYFSGGVVMKDRIAVVKKEYPQEQQEIPEAQNCVNRHVEFFKPQPSAVFQSNLIVGEIISKMYVRIQSLFQSRGVRQYLLFWLGSVFLLSMGFPFFYQSVALVGVWGGFVGANIYQLRQRFATLSIPVGYLWIIAAVAAANFFSCLTLIDFSFFSYKLFSFFIINFLVYNELIVNLINKNITQKIYMQAVEQSEKLEFFRKEVEELYQKIHVFSDFVRLQLKAYFLTGNLQGKELKACFTAAKAVDHYLEQISLGDESSKITLNSKLRQDLGELVSMEKLVSGMPEETILSQFIPILEQIFEELTVFVLSEMKNDLETMLFQAHTSRDVTLEDQYAKVLDGIINRALELNGLPEEVAVLAAGSYGRRQQTYGTDLDMVVVISDDLADKLEKNTEESEYIKRQLLRFRRNIGSLSFIFDEALIPVPEDQRRKKFWLSIGEYLKFIYTRDNLTEVQQRGLLDLRAVSYKENPVMRAIQYALYNAFINPESQNIPFLTKIAKELNHFNQRDLNLVAPLEQSIWEINIKSSAGFLRNISFIVWGGRALTGIVEPKEAIRQLAEKKFFTNDEERDLQGALNFFMRIRSEAHFIQQQAKQLGMKKIVDEFISLVGRCNIPVQTWDSQTQDSLIKLMAVIGSAPDIINQQKLVLIASRFGYVSVNDFIVDLNKYYQHVRDLSVKVHDKLRARIKVLEKGESGPQDSKQTPGGIAFISGGGLEFKDDDLFFKGDDVELDFKLLPN